MKYYFILMAFFCSGITVCQSQTNIDPVNKKTRIGVGMPDFELSPMMNYPTGKMKISDWRGKYIILDFWHSRCSSCIQGFPHLKKLQDKYNGQLKIVLVNYESKEFIKKFLIRNQKITGQSVDLPIACQDTQLNAYFKPESFPYCVWLDEKGIVRHISSGPEVNNENIEAVLHNQPIQIAERDDEDLIFDFSKPLLVNSNGSNGSAIIYNSVLTGYIKNMPSSGEVDYAGTVNSRMTVYNYPILEMYQTAFNDYINGYSLPPNRTVLRVKDTTKYVWYIKGMLKYSNQYNYQLLAPFRTREELQRMMRQDLARYFGLEAHMEKKIMKCWVLSSEDTSLLLTRGGDPENQILVRDFSMIVRNVPDSALAFRFIYNIFYSSPHPFLSDIHMKSNIDLQLTDVNFDDPDDVIRAIKKYKLNIRLEDRPVDILIISEPDYKPEDKL